VERTEGRDREGAWTRVKRGQLQLMLQQPFLASAVARLPMSDETDSGWCPTAATDGYHIFVNVRFF
jgi:hypothetical protein